ncbi:hypothetical protein [Vulgatibacter sp.]|uniref:hypothetical protein n=1 Tax=Vulgatibacter sp. TaxID=1971226 RepID=UPI0035624384
MLAALLLAAAGIAGVACAEEVPREPPPLDQLFFPTGAALSSDGTVLLVTSGNFDLRYRSGVLHAFDVAALDRLADEADGEPCPGTADCAPPRNADIGSALVDSTEIGDFAGQLGLGSVGGLDRAFIPLRGSDTVLAVDVAPGSADGDVLRCVRQNDERCLGASFPRRDPFSVAVLEGNVYVGHIGRDGDDDPIGLIGAARADDDALWREGDGEFARIGLGEQPAGGIAAGACRDEAEGRTCTLFATARTLEQGFNPVFLFDFRAGELRTSPVFSLNVFGQQRGLDTRGVAVSSDGNAIFVAERFPDALATIDVSRTGEQRFDGCVVPSGEQLPPEGSCPPGPVPLGGEEPRFVTADLVPVPEGPNAVFVIPRTLPGGGTSDLVVVTNDDGLYFVDTRTGLASGAVENIGIAPAAVAVRPNGTGARLYVPSFGEGTLAVIDLPDLFRPSSAEVVAILGNSQEGAL